MSYTNCDLISSSLPVTQAFLQHSTPYLPIFIPHVLLFQFWIFLALCSSSQQSHAGVRNDQFHFVLHCVIHQMSTTAISPHSWFIWNVLLLVPVVTKSSCRDQRPRLSSLFLNFKLSVATSGYKKIVLPAIGRRGCRALKIPYFMCVVWQQKELCGGLMCHCLCRVTE